MRVLDLACKDLRQLVRDWKAAAFLVAMPIVFTLMFGFAFGGFGGEVDPRLPVGFVDQDGGALSRSLLEALDRSETIRPVVLEASDADRVDEQVREGDLAAAVLVPAGYGDSLLAGAPVGLTVIVDEGSTGGLAARSEIQAAAFRVVGAVQAALVGAQAFAARVGFADEAARQQFMDAAVEEALAAWADPPLTVRVTQSGAIEAASAYGVGGFSHASPSMMVQFAIAGLTGAGEILVLERKSRALQRLLTTAISRAEVIAGHYLAMFLMILVQLALLVAFGQLALRLDYLREPLALLLIIVTIALWVAALGLLIGVLSRSEEHVIIMALVLMFVLSGLGGAWLPLEYTGRTFQTIGHLLPTAWAMDGLENIVIRGLGLESALRPAGVMFAYAVGIFALALWRFRKVW